jgi:flagellar biosynthesis/type III secretory pathway protein FliH
MLAEKVNRWIAEYKAEGKIEGRVEGREEGKVEGRAEGKVEGREEGKVEGRAEGIVLSLKRLITKNTISIEEAKTEIEELEKNGVLNQEEVKRVSRELGIR